MEHVVIPDDLFGLAVMALGVVLASLGVFMIAGWGGGLLAAGLLTIFIGVILLAASA